MKIISKRGGHFALRLVGISVFLLIVGSFSALPLMVYMNHFNAVTVTIGYGLYALEIVGLWWAYRWTATRHALTLPKLTAQVDQRWLLTILIGVVVILGVCVVHVQLMKGFGIPEPENARDLDKMMQLHPTALLIDACLFGPICEELLFRGLFFNLSLSSRQAQQRVYQVVAVVVNGMLFGFLHCDNSFEPFLYYSLFGAVLAVSYLTSKRDIRVDISIHMLANIMIAVLGF